MASAVYTCICSTLLLSHNFFYIYKDCFAFPLQRKEALTKINSFLFTGMPTCFLGQRKALLLRLGIGSHMVPATILLIFEREQSLVGAWQGGPWSQPVRNHVWSPEPRCVICCWLCLLPGSHNSAYLFKILMLPNIVTIEVSDCVVLLLLWSQLQPVTQNFGSTCTFFSKLWMELTPDGNSALKIIKGMAFPEGFNRDLLLAPLKSTWGLPRGHCGEALCI